MEKYRISYIEREVCLNVQMCRQCECYFSTDVNTYYSSWYVHALYLYAVIELSRAYRTWLMFALQQLYTRYYKFRLMRHTICNKKKQLISDGLVIIFNSLITHLARNN